MKRKTNVIDLGIASKETKGPVGIQPDETNGQNLTGILKD